MNFKKYGILTCLCFAVPAGVSVMSNSGMCMFKKQMTQQQKQNSEQQYPLQMNKNVQPKFHSGNITLGNIEKFISDNESEFNEYLRANWQKLGNFFFTMFVNKVNPSTNQAYKKNEINNILSTKVVMLGKEIKDENFKVFFEMLCLYMHNVVRNTVEHNKLKKPFGDAKVTFTLSDWIKETDLKNYTSSNHSIILRNAAIPEWCIIASVACEIIDPKKNNEVKINENKSTSSTSNGKGTKTNENIMDVNSSEILQLSEIFESAIKAVSEKKLESLVKSLMENYINTNVIKLINSNKAEVASVRKDVSQIKQNIEEIVKETDNNRKIVDSNVETLKDSLQGLLDRVSECESKLEIISESKNDGNINLNQTQQIHSAYFEEDDNKIDKINNGTKNNFLKNESDNNGLFNFGNTNQYKFGGETDYNNVVEYEGETGNNNGFNFGYDFGGNSQQQTSNSQPKKYDFGSIS